MTKEKIYHSLGALKKDYFEGKISGNEIVLVSTKGGNVSHYLKDLFPDIKEQKIVIGTSKGIHSKGIMMRREPDFYYKGKKTKVWTTEKPKRGWYKESARHALARKGIKTGRKKKLTNEKAYAKRELRYYGEEPMGITLRVSKKPAIEKTKTLQPFALKHKEVKKGTGETFQYDVLGQFYPTGEKVGKLYQRYYKGREAKIEWMSPDEYLDKIDEGIKSKGATSGIREVLSQKRINELARGMKKGDKFAMPWIEYEKGIYAGHEGKHRAATAKQLGIKKIPVVISNRVSESEDHEAWMKAKKKYGIKE